MKQLSTTQALVGYGIGGAVAYAGWYNNTVLAMGMFTLFIIGFVTTLIEGGY